MVADAISIGMTATLTGRYSLPGQQALLGVQAWVEETTQSGGTLGAGARAPACPCV